MLKRLMMAAAAVGLALGVTAAEAQQKFKVGFVNVGPKTDGGWTQGHWTGVQMLEKELGDKVEITFLENVPEGPDAERAIEGLVQAGNKLIFTTSFGFMEPTLKVAAKYPDVMFEHATGFKTAPNVTTYNARFYQGRYIIGQIAAKLSNGNLIVLTNQPAYAKIAQTQFLGVRMSIWLALAVIIVLGLLLSRTTNGRYIYAAGGNAQAARLAGVRINFVVILAFTINGAAAALGGIIDTSRVLSAQSSSGGNTLTFLVLTGIVVGGTSILGGAGAIWRTVVGVLFIALVGNGFDLLGLDPLYEQITLGIILLVAVGTDAWSRLRQS